MNKRISKLYDLAVKQAESLLQEDSKVSGVLDESIEKMGSVTDRIYDFQDKLMALYRMLRSYVQREYTDISSKTLIASVAALLYFVNPFDAIPDFVPLAGFIDDAALITYVFTLISSEIDRFSSWEREKNTNTNATIEV